MKGLGNFPILFVEMFKGIALAEIITISFFLLNLFSLEDEELDAQSKKLLKQALKGKKQSDAEDDDDDDSEEDEE